MLYKEWTSTDGCIIDMLEQTLNVYTDKVLNEEAKELYQNPDIPLYCKNFKEAKELQETRFWKADRKRSEDCFTFFNQNAEHHYHARNFTPFLKEWVNTFGVKRCKTILAQSIKEHTYDGRYSKSVKENASNTIIPNDTYKKFYSNVHPVVINSAYEKLMNMDIKKSKLKSKNNKKHPEFER